MGKHRLYSYDIKNREKFAGDSAKLTVRSSWELKFAEHCDLLPSVISWAYEAVKIPYRDPLTNSQKLYIPDFFVEIAQHDGMTKHYVFEIKPMHEQLDDHAKSRRDAALIARNRAKWKAASMWADRHSSEFMILNEADLFSFHNNKIPRKNPIKTFTNATKTTGQLARASKSLSRVTKKPIAASIKPTLNLNRTSKTTGRASRIRRVRRAKRI